MQYHNPLSIFNDAQIQRLNQSSLHELKNELIALFREPSDTIERNGNIYNKAEVLQIFENLENDLDLHLAIDNNKHLSNFLQHGNLSFFSTKDATAKVIDDGANKFRIDQFISNKLNTILPGLVANVDDNTLDKVKLFHSYTTQMNAKNQSSAYEQTYTELNAFVQQLPKDFKQPFDSDMGIKLHPELDSKIDARLYNCFKYFPENFKDISYPFAVWCHNDVANAAFNREKNFERYTRKDLITLFKAMQIGSKVTNSEDFKTNTQTVKNYLSTNGKPVPSEGTNNMTGLKVLGMILLVGFSIAKFATRCARFNNDQSAVVSNTRNTNSFERMQKLQQKNAEDAMKLNKKLSLQRYTGDEKDLWKDKFINSREHDGYEELNFEVDLFPTTTEDFKNMIPASIIKKYAKRSDQQFVLYFKNPDFPKIKMQHRVKAKYTNGFMSNLNYDGFQNKSRKDKVKLTTARFSTKNGELKGTITRYEELKSDPIFKKKFSINYSKSEYTRLKNEQKLDLGGPYDKFQPYNISGIEDENLKNVILNNLSVVHNKQLKMGNYYTLEDIAFYYPQDKNKIAEIQEAKGSLTFAHGSMEDNIGVIKLDGKEYQLRYFASKETKKILGMHMVCQHPSTKQMEVIEVFYQ